jgi:hypothetical protein
MSLGSNSHLPGAFSTGFLATGSDSILTGSLTFGTAFFRSVTTVELWLERMQG